MLTEVVKCDSSPNSPSSGIRERRYTASPPKKNIPSLYGDYPPTLPLTIHPPNIYIYIYGCVRETLGGLPMYFFFFARFGPSGVAPVRWVMFVFCFLTRFCPSGAAQVRQITFCFRFLTRLRLCGLAPVRQSNTWPLFRHNGDQRPNRAPDGSGG